jgi:hypothetical protein
MSAVDMTGVLAALEAAADTIEMIEHSIAERAAFAMASLPQLREAVATSFDVETLKRFDVVAERLTRASLRHVRN